MLLLAKMRFNPQNLLRKPYPYYVDFSKNLPYFFGFSLFITLFLIIFQPFGLSNYRGADKNFILIGYGLTFFIVISFTSYVTPKLFTRIFHEENWTLGKEILWMIWNCLIIIFASAVYGSVVSGQMLSTSYLLRVAVNGFFITIFLMPFCIMLNYIRLMKTKLRKAEEITRKLESLQKVSRNESIEFISESQRERLKLPIQSLLFIRSYDNYANIVRQDNGRIREMLLRTSLKNLEEQLTVPFVIRCHRSFIVNLSRVQSVVGSARNYTLTLDNYDDPIPVSRTSEKQVLEILANLDQ